MIRLAIKTTFFFSVCLLMATNAQAQIGSRIKERIKQETEQKVEDKVVNKAGDKTDKALDSLFKERKRPGTITKDEDESDERKRAGTITKDESDSERTANPGFNFAGITNAKYESSYTLQQEFKIEIKTQEKKKKDKVETVNMNMFYGEDCYMAIVVDEEQKTTPKNLMDLKNNTSVMLNDTDMSAMAISMDFVTSKINDAVVNDSTDADSEYTFTKTGNTKTIAGYLCEEYIIESDESKMNVWYTDDITIQMHQNMGQYAMFGSFSSAISEGSDGKLVGTMMESHMVEKTGDEGTFDYLVKEVKVETTVLNMGDYTFTSLGGR